MEVLLTVLGGETDVAAISKQDIKQVMEVVENLPKRVVQPYRSMSIQQLIECGKDFFRSGWIEHDEDRKSVC